MPEKPLLAQYCRLAEAFAAELSEAFELYPLHDGVLPAKGEARAAQVRALVTDGGYGAPAALFEALPNLEIVAVFGVGVDRVDFEAGRRAGVKVANTPDVLTEDVADLAVGMTIALIRDIVPADRFVRDGLWPGGSRPLARRMSGRRFGVVGLGRIGRAIADRLAPFGPVAYHAKAPKDCPYRYCPDLIELAAASDVLLLAASANAANHRLVDARVLRALGPDGVLVNVARGSLVDEAALTAAVEDGTIAGAALDVFEHEPEVPAALRRMSNVLLSPHAGSATSEARRGMADLVLRNLNAHFAGQRPPNLVS